MKNADRILPVLLLAASVLAFDVATAQSITVVGIGVYWDQDCTLPVSSVNWGFLSPGSSRNFIVFVRNEGSEAVALSLVSSNWNPAKAADFISLAWDYSGEVIEPSETVLVTLNLCVSSFIVEVDSFSFDITVSVILELAFSAYTIAAMGTIVYTEVIGATLDFSPQALNLVNKGKWITAYIELPEGYDVKDIDVSSVMLNESIPAEPRPTVIGDFDNDASPDIMVKFDRAQVTSYIRDHISLEGVDRRVLPVTLAITGRLVDGAPFQGFNAVRIVGTRA